MTRTVWHMPRSRPEKALYDTVFKRMKRHHDEPAIGPEQPPGSFQTALQLGELLIDGDAQRLKSPGRGMNLLAVAWSNALNECRQLASGGDRPGPDNGPRDARCARLFAQTPKQISKLGF